LEGFEVMGRLLPVAAALGALAATAAPARAADELVVRGHGWGHGVGMSQWGAYGMAKDGADAPGILAHYFTGTSLDPAAAAGRRVRVLLKTARSIRVRGATRAGRRHLSARRTYTATSNGLRGVVLRSGRKVVTRSSGALRLRGTSRAPVQVRGTAGFGVRNGRWRGVVELRPSSVGPLQAIEDVSLEDYVRGVVSSEMSASWPAAALQAQAIAARTYAITVRKSDADFDQYADTRSQAYKGMAGETDATDAAVRATRGQVVTYRGKPVPTYFFASSGGRTENVENGFPGTDPAPWLVAVDDPAEPDSATDHDWTVRLSLRRAESKLGRLVDGHLRSIDVTARGASPRVVKATVVGSGGRTTVTGDQLRARLGLPSTWASFDVR
jgi:stage II sporulation protein D